MQKNQETWRSPSLGKKMTISIYGNSGVPVIGFPARGGQSDQWESQGMTEAVTHQLENGYNQLFCIDSVDEESFLNQKIKPEKRLMRQQQFEAYIIEEVLPFIQQQNPLSTIILAGVDMGGYQAVNLALRHPEDFVKAIGISGIYDIKPFLDGFYNDTVYFNNPVDFVPNISTQSLLDKIRNVDFRLTSFRDDSRLESTRILDYILRSKFVEHQADIWEAPAENEWSIWPKILKKHII